MRFGAKIQIGAIPTSEYERWKVDETYNTGWVQMNGPPNTKVNFSCNKRLNLPTKFGVLGFLGIINLEKKIGGSISKIVDFSLLSNFC